MIKQLAWNMFKSTGNIDTFMELKQIENIEKNIKSIQKVELDGNNKNEGNNYSGKQYGGFWQNGNNANSRTSEKFRVLQKELGDKAIAYLQAHNFYVLGSTYYIKIMRFIK